MSLVEDKYERQKAIVETLETIHPPKTVIRIAVVADVYTLFTNMLTVMHHAGVPPEHVANFANSAHDMYARVASLLFPDANEEVAKDIAALMSQQNWFLEQVDAQHR